MTQRQRLPQRLTTTQTLLVLICTYIHDRDGNELLCSLGGLFVWRRCSHLCLGVVLEFHCPTDRRQLTRLSSGKIKIIRMELLNQRRFFLWSASDNGKQQLDGFKVAAEQIYCHCRTLSGATTCAIVQSTEILCSLYKLSQFTDAVSISGRLCCSLACSFQTRPPVLCRVKGSWKHRDHRYHAVCHSV